MWVHAMQLGGWGKLLHRWRPGVAEGLANLVGKPTGVAGSTACGLTREAQRTNLGGMGLRSVGCSVLETWRCGSSQRLGRQGVGSPGIAKESTWGAMGSQACAYGARCLTGSERGCPPCFNDRWSPAGAATGAGGRSAGEEGWERSKILSGEKKTLGKWACSLGRKGENITCIRSGKCKPFWGGLAGFGKGRLRTDFTPTCSRPGLQGPGYQPGRAEGTHLIRWRPRRPSPRTRPSPRRR